MLLLFFGRSIPLEIYLRDIFPKNGRLVYSRLLNRLLEDHLASIQRGVIIATDASRCEEKSGIGIYSPSLNWSFPLRQVDFIPIFYAEFFAIALAQRRLDASIVCPVIIRFTFSLLCPNCPWWSLLQRTFRSLVPPHLTAGISLNEAADFLAWIALSRAVVEVIQSPFLITAARCRWMLMPEGIHFVITGRLSPP